MKIKMLTILSGPGLSAAPGDIIDLPEKDAAQLVAGGYADPLDPPRHAPPEAAIIEPAETATPAKPRRRRAK